MVRPSREAIFKYLMWIIIIQTNDGNGNGNGNDYDYYYYFYCYEFGLVFGLRLPVYTTLLP